MVISVTTISALSVSLCEAENVRIVRFPDRIGPGPHSPDTNQLNYRQVTKTTHITVNARPTTHYKDTQYKVTTAL